MDKEKKMFNAFILNVYYFSSWRHAALYFSFQYFRIRDKTLTKIPLYYVYFQSWILFLDHCSALSRYTKPISTLIAQFFTFIYTSNYRS